MFLRISHSTLSKSEMYIMTEKFFMMQDGQKPIQVAAARGNREAVKILFPLTSPIKNISDWSIDGVIEHMQSELRKEQVACHLCFLVM